MACFRLELKDTSGMSVHPGLYEDDEPSGYDYENDHDTSEYCPNVALVSTVKSALQPLYLLATCYSYTDYDEVVNKCFLLGRSLVQVLSRKYTVLRFVLVFRVCASSSMLAF
jgi:hypothetical protein